MELLHQPGEIIAERYRIVSILGQGGIGITYESEDLHAGKRVALKGLSLHRMTDWKVLELFEREARVLSHLKHPSIPRYLDYFQIDTPQNQGFYLVQELAEGRSLAALVQSGWHATEAEVKQIAIQILEILNYLHRLAPSVIHRDIKPQNIIRREDGQIFLVDFGSVQDTYQNTFARGSTVVGTYGYMAPEQFRGQAFPATDLYGLGATILFLLTHRSPADFPQRQLKIDFRSQLQISTEFGDWLEKLLEPAAENRFRSAQEALSVLKGEGVLVPTRRKPARSRISLTKTPRQLVIEIPPQWWGYWDVGEFVIALTWLLTSSFLTSLIRFSAINPVVWIFPLISIIFWMVGLAKLRDALFKLAGRTRLEINRQSFRLRWSLLGVFYLVQGRAQDIDQVGLNDFIRREDEWIAKLRNELPEAVTACTLVEGVRTHRFGSWLTQQEKEWLIQEVATFLKKPLYSPSLPQ